MFEKVVLRHSDAGSALTIGELAEGLYSFTKTFILSSTMAA